MLADYCLPGFKAGGPVRSLSSLVEALGDEILFHIVTRDSDLSDNEPFSGITRIKKELMSLISIGFTRYFSNRLKKGIS